MATVGLDRLWKFADGGELWLKSGDATVYRSNRMRSPRST